MRIDPATIDKAALAERMSRYDNDGETYASIMRRGQFSVGAQVRINEGHYYGQVGTVVRITSLAYVVRVRGVDVECGSVISTFANNGD